VSIALGFVTAEKPYSAQMLIRSARRFLGNIEVYVVDQSFEIEAMAGFYEATRVNVLRLPPQIRLHAALNTMLREIGEEFVLLCDDNLVLGPCSAVEEAMKVLEKQPDVGVVRGQLHEIDVYEPMSGANLYAGDSAANFCILRRCAFLEGGQWDEPMRPGGENSDFFLNLMRNTKWRIVYLPSLAALKVRAGPEYAGEATAAADVNDEFALKGAEGFFTGVNRRGSTARRADVVSAETEVHPFAAETASAAAIQNRTSLSSLLEQSADLPLFDARAAVMRCCYSPARSGDKLLVWCRPQLSGRERKRKAVVVCRWRS
jgi:hypothetical protein